MWGTFTTTPKCPHPGTSTHTHRPLLHWNTSSFSWDLEEMLHSAPLQPTCGQFAGRAWENCFPQEEIVLKSWRVPAV